MHSKQKLKSGRRYSPRALMVAVGGALLATLTTTCTPMSVADVAYTVRHASESEPPSRLDIPRVARRIDHLVIVTIDGVRWQEVFLGMDPRRGASTSGVNPASQLPADLMPELHRIAQTRGILLGSDESKVFVSSPSTVSLPGYSELFSGRTPKCGNNDCASTEEPTLLDDWRRSDETATMALVSSWSRIPRVAVRDGAQLVVSAGKARPRNFDGLLGDATLRGALDRGLRASPAPGTDDYRPDRFTAEVGLRLLETCRPNFLFLGLGDTDEQAHRGNYGAYLQALHDADSVVGRIDAWLKAQQRIGRRTLLVVTTDHGRAASFQHHGGTSEASRIWTLWSGDPVLERGYPPATDSRLADLAPTLRPLLGLDPDSDPQSGRDLSAVLGQMAEPSYAIAGIGPVATQRLP
jgi:hypothetical protein